MATYIPYRISMRWEGIGDDSITSLWLTVAPVRLIGVFGSTAATAAKVGPVDIPEGAGGWTGFTMVAEDVGPITQIEVLAPKEADQKSDLLPLRLIQGTVEWPGHRFDDPAGNKDQSWDPTWTEGDRLYNGMSFRGPPEGIPLTLEHGITVDAEYPLAPAELGRPAKRMKYAGHDFRVIVNEIDDQSRSPVKQTVAFSRSVTHGVEIHKSKTHESGSESSVTATFSYTPPQETGGAGSSVTTSFGTHVTDTVGRVLGKTTTETVTTTDTVEVEVAPGTARTAVNIFIQAIESYDLTYAGYTVPIESFMPAPGISVVLDHAASAQEIEDQITERLAALGIERE